MMSSASGSGCSTPDTLYIFGNQPQVNENRSNIDENLLQSSEGGTTERSASPAADALSLLYEPTTEDQSKPETSTSDIFFGSDLKQEGLTSTPVAQRCTDRSVINNESKSSSVNLSQGPDCTSTDLVLNTVDTNPTADCSVDNTDGLKQHSRVEHVSSLLGGPQNGGTSGTPASDSPATYNSMGSGVESESSDMERECSLTSSFTQTYHNLHETLTVPIVGFEVMEERARFTVFKVHVKMGPGENWFIFRRYTDFVRLNEKLTVLFPHFRLALPPKRWFGDNFDNNFLEDRQLGLQAFLNNVTSHKDICLSKPVREFLCLDDPPGRHDTLEESKALCESLEDDMYHLQQDLEDRDRRISLLEQELDLQRMEIVNLKKALKSEKLGRHSISSSTEHLVEADQQRYNSSKARDSKDNSPFKKSASKEKFQAEMNSPNRLSIIEISEECSSTESMTNATPVATS